MIENDNLFKALVSFLVAILFIVLAVNSFSTGGLVLFKVLFVLIALVYTLFTLAYAAYYTNDHFRAQTGEVG